MFLLNFVLCTIIGTGLIILRLGSSCEAKTTLPVELSVAQEPQSALELANIMGQAHGLSEAPQKNDHPLNKGRLIQAAEKAIGNIVRTSATSVVRDKDTHGA